MRPTMPHSAAAPAAPHAGSNPSPLPSPLPSAGPMLATYANYSEVGHNAFEFLIDYGQVRPDGGGIEIHTRIVAGPVPAKLFARLLNDAIARFEAENGEIPDAGEQDALALLMAASPDFEHRASEARMRPGPAAPAQPSPSLTIQTR